ncbi:MAG: carbamoyl-phosphate synthase subunit L, partial [Hyphomicrobiales bacterium]|nr:carbamoyl-phosphate synthase subunit L [Hyphomicrobiales bacterium]
LVEEKNLTDETQFYFLEMNTRLQVEHPVTEQVTGLDLVEWQIRVASGEALTFAQDDISLAGHALEARLYAEDPDRDFLPSAGRLYLVRWPDDESVRIETGIETGDSVSPFYDPLLAKIITTGTDRADAIRRLRAALGDTAIAGPTTNLAFLHALLGHRDVAAGHLDTGLIGREFATSSSTSASAGTIRAGLEALIRAKQHKIAGRRRRFSNENATPWDAADGFSLGRGRAFDLDLLIGSERVPVRVSWNGGEAEISFPGDGGEETDSDEREFTTVIAGRRVFVLDRLRQTEIELGAAAALDRQEDEQAGVVRAPMHGRIVKIHAQAGDQVTKGERLAVLEAMKMEHMLHAPRDGVISDIAASEGMQVDEGAVIAVVGDADTT